MGTRYTGCGHLQNSTQINTNKQNTKINNKTRNYENFKQRNYENLDEYYSNRK